MNDRMTHLDDCLKRIECDIQRTCNYSTREIRVVQALEALRECLVKLDERTAAIECYFECRIEAPEPATDHTLWGGLDGRDLFHHAATTLDEEVNDD